MQGRKHCSHLDLRKYILQVEHSNNVNENMNEYLNNNHNDYSYDFLCNPLLQQDKYIEINSQSLTDCYNNYLID